MALTAPDHELQKTMILQCLPASAGREKSAVPLGNFGKCDGDRTPHRVSGSYSIYSRECERKLGLNWGINHYDKNIRSNFIDRVIRGVRRTAAGL